VKSFAFLAGFLQLAPEIVKVAEVSGHIPHGTQESDVYGLGMILYQILFRVEPYNERTETIDGLWLRFIDCVVLRPTSHYVNVALRPKQSD
jgi:hypothetical protein